MTSGFLGKAIPAANTWNNIYTVPTGKLASISINAVNQSGAQTNIDFVISTSSTSGGIATSEYIEFATLLPGASSLERTGLVTDDVAGKYIWVRSGNASTAFQVYGYEESN
jgi:hypothetical protein